uniref:palmitoyl-protein hydrolase n=1 Tax=Lygus hesperus TaxID=30085 RepID=A0A0A9Y2F9_LYGHE
MVQLMEGVTCPSHVKMYFPSAQEMYVKFRDKMTTSWFDGERIGKNLQEVDCNYDQCDKSADIIVNLIRQIEASGIPSNRIVLAGISQGGMLAQYVAFTKVRGIAGVLVMATVFPFTKAKFLKPPHPILHQLYGSKDPIIPIEGVRMAEVFLKYHGVNLNLRILQNSGHDMDVDYVKTFFSLLNKILPP